MKFFAICIQILFSGTVKNLSDSQWVLEPVFFILTVWILKFLYVFYDLWDLFAVIIVCEIFFLVQVIINTQSGVSWEFFHCIPEAKTCA